MKIRKLQLKNIGVFDDETIEFQKCPKGKAEIHIFTGQNGSGKSTILMGLASAFSSNNGFYHDLRNGLEKRFKNNYPRLVGISLEDNCSEEIYKASFQLVSSKILMQRNPVIDEFSKLFYETGIPDYTFEFCPFAYSGYRRIRSESIEAIKEPTTYNPLTDALNFVKSYDQKDQLTINQLIVNNISKSAIERGRNEKKSEKFANVIKLIEQAISEITNWTVEFDLETEPTKLITKVNDEDLDFDVLPDGLRSLISWIADLAGRVDLLKWQDDLPIFEKNLILFLDEIEVHLHPAWQRKVLPVVQKLFKNSQIFVSTHSPFVVNSVDDAWIYKLELEDGKAKVGSIERSEDARSYRYVLRNTFDIDSEFGVEIEKRLEDFYRERDILLAENGNSKKAKTELKKIAKELSSQSKELKTKIDFELFQLSEITGEKF